MSKRTICPPILFCAALAACSHQTSEVVARAETVSGLSVGEPAGSAALVHFALCLAQQPQVVFGVLLKVLGGHTVIAQLCIAGQLVVFLDNLLRRAAHLALGAGAVKNTVDDIAAATLRRAFAVILRPGA